MKTLLRLILFASVLIVVAGPVRALGPVDGEISALYWGSDTRTNAADEGSGAAGGRAEAWFFKKFGASVARFAPSPEGALASTELGYTNLDLKWRLLSPTQNNFVALGAGWQKFSVAGLPDGDSDGVRIVAEGRVGIVKVLYFYGRTAYLPSLSDLDTGVERLSHGTGREAEIGLQLKPWPFMQFFAGYRQTKIQFTSSVGDVDIDSAGPVAGFGVSF